MLKTYTYDFIADGFSYGVTCVDLCICDMLVLRLYIYIRSPAEIVGSNPAGGMDVCLFRVLSGRGFCDEPITRPEDAYRMWCVVVCDLETS